MHITYTWHALRAARSQGKHHTARDSASTDKVENPYGTTEPPFDASDCAVSNTKRGNCFAFLKYENIKTRPGAELPYTFMEMDESEVETLGKSK